jgi:hypothetical protein
LSRLESGVSPAAGDDEVEEEAAEEAAEAEEEAEAEEGVRWEVVEELSVGEATEEPLAAMSAGDPGMALDGDLNALASGVPKHVLEAEGTRSGSSTRSPPPWDPVEDASLTTRKYGG